MEKLYSISQDDRGSYWFKIVGIGINNPVAQIVFLSFCTYSSGSIVIIP